jgi:molybdopterin-containing oxidoreductase family iron-sulfur binding subunit
LVKTREGRPIKIEGNSLSSVTKGGTSARAQASVLGLYDTSRISGPFRVKNGVVEKPSTRNKKGPGWKVIDAEIMAALNSSSRIRIISPTIQSPTTKKAIADFTLAFPNTKLISYDAVSASALLQANEACFGEAVVPNYQFDKADVIVSFEADFLGTWISPIEYATQYVKNRRITDVKNPKMSKHIQVESHMSLTGSNADNRILVKPSEQGAAILSLYNALAALAGLPTQSGPTLSAAKASKFKVLAATLFEAKGKSLVVSGSNNMGEQILVNAINQLLGNYGSTIDFANASLQRQGIDKGVNELIAEMAAGKVDALFLLDGANPAWDIPRAGSFVTAAKKVKLKVSFSIVPNESTALCDYVTPTHHLLESWGDAQPKKGFYSLIQPTISPLFDTRQTEVSLLTWAKSEALNATAEQPALDYLMKYWESSIFPMQNRFAIFRAFWDSCLHDGIFELPSAMATAIPFNGDVQKAATMIRKPVQNGLEISFFETINMGGGQYGNNPWLSELPDPVSRTSWGNYLAVPVKWEGGNRFTSLNDLNPREIYGEADMVDLEINGTTQMVTAVRQFGQLENTVGLALGYGRTVTGYMGKALGNHVGINVYPWLSVDEQGNTQYYAVNAKVSDPVDKEDLFACVQYHHAMGVTGKDPKTGETLNVDEKTSMTIGSGYQGGIVNRSIIYKGNLDELSELLHHVEEKRAEADELNSKTLYPIEEYTDKQFSQGHWWAMHVDLNACIGCGACSVACMAENNVPVVGKREVGRHHEMSWLRIDRYFFGEYENPNTVYQPMMCQHCDNAPCENVCPVAATPHSSEGLNQMTYNRCIGTRYCANNCPYKVRRFNWLDYTKADMFAINEPKVKDEELPFGADNLTRMVLNPDVTVRSRGVIEKCSFCVQRIQEGKLTAKKEGRSLQDNDVRTACQTACPTGAIVFGDRNNKTGDLSKKLDNPLNYIVLEEIGVRSSVNYTAKVVNRSEKLDA